MRDLIFAGTENELDSNQPLLAGSSPLQVVQSQDSRKYIAIVPSLSLLWAPQKYATHKLWVHETENWFFWSEEKYLCVHFDILLATAKIFVFNILFAAAGPRQTHYLPLHSLLSQVRKILLLSGEKFSLLSIELCTCQMISWSFDHLTKEKHPTTFCTISTAPRWDPV